MSQNSGQRLSSGSSESGEEQLGDHPKLMWKPHLFSHLRKLKTANPSVSFTTLKDAFNSAYRRGRGNVVLVTRMEVSWTTYEYIGSSPFGVGFKDLAIGGLPLGGMPFAPQTYVIDGRGHIAQIVFGKTYKLLQINRPTGEPAVLSWVYAVVPVEEANDGGNLTWKPQVTLAPTLGEVPGMLAWVNQHMSKEAKIKSGGARHAWSKIALTDDVFVLPDRLKLAHTIDQEPDIYRADLGERRGNLVRVGSGHTISETNRFLWEHGKAFPALGGFDGQTMGGVFNTGTHGSVFTRGPLADMILSIDLVTADCRVLRIERQNGVTDPAKLALDRPDLELIQENECFYSALINMGTMGVVLSYMLEVTNAFHLKEVRTPMNLEGMKMTLRGGKIYSLCGVEGKPSELEKTPPKVSNGKDGGFKDQPFPAYHLEFLFNPHSDEAVVTSRHPIAVDKVDAAEFGFHPPGRDLLWTIERGAQFSRPAFATWIQERFTKLLSWSVSTLMKLFPNLTPRLIDSAMDTLIDDAYIDRSFNVFNAGDGENRIPALAGSIFVPIEKDKYIDAIQIIQDVAKEFAGRKKHATGPASMRFIRSTPALLGCPKDYCSFEFIFTANTAWALEMVEAYDIALRKKFGNEIRAHWGQLMRDPTPEEIRGMYPRYDRWRAIRNEFDPQGRFLSEWQSRTLPPI